MRHGCLVSLPGLLSSFLVSSLVSVLALLAVFAHEPAAAQVQGEAQTGLRVALVIGNSAYLHAGALANPVNDANAMSKLFTDAGFATVVPKTDLGITALRRSLADFEVLAREADVAVVYYSGHGIEFAGENYLVPVDAAMERDVDIKDETVPLSRVLEAVAGAKRLKLVILDACRTDPFKATAKTRAISRGLARIEPTEADELVAYSAKAGSVASDGDAGAHSPYTAALLARLMTPGLDIELALRRVRDDVLTATHRAQEPFYYGSLGADELPLMAKPAVVAALPTVVAALPVVVPKPAASADAAIGECDRLAASPYDTTRSAGIAGVDPRLIDAALAVPACRAALAARPDDPRLEFELGRSLTKAGGAEVEAAALYRKSSEAGFSAAMVNLGVCLRTGLGVAKDEAEASSWWRKAAKAGNSMGMNNLGVSLRDGVGQPKDPAEAARWFRMAAEAGVPFAMVNLGLALRNGAGVTKDDEEATLWFRSAAEAGATDGMNDLGRSYESGLGVPVDRAEAWRWYQKSAAAGYAPGMVNLARAYQEGIGVLRDEAEAARWWRKAAKAGNSIGMSNLAISLRDGIGQPKDLAEAARWFRVAAEAGVPAAMNNLGLALLNGDAVAKDQAEATLWFRNAAEAGSADGMNNLGRSYENGLGVPVDKAEALRWYQKAADAGNAAAKVALQRLAAAAAKLPQ